MKQLLFVVLLVSLATSASAHGSKTATCHQHGATSTHCHGGKP